VLSRGELVVEHDTLTDAAQPGRGQFVHRDRFYAADPFQIDIAPTTQVATHA